MHLKSTNRQYSGLVLVMVLAVAVATAWLAWPRMQASLRFLPVDLAIDRYHQDRELPSQRMLTLIGFAEQAIEHHDHYRYHEGLSFLYYLRGLDVQTPALQRGEAYREAERAAIATVQRAPARPETWLRIATVRSILRDEPETIVAAWQMSIFTGRTHSTLIVPRTGIGLAYLNLLDDESRSMLRDQLLLAWSLKPAQLLQELKRGDPGLANTRALIALSDPQVLAQMEAGSEKIR